FLIDANGVVRYRHVGDVNPTNWASTLQPMYQELLEEAK
ncbi:DsbE family thiol:disulfide interchange protein, partial [Vibrio sp. 10N.261.48.A2]